MIRTALVGLLVALSVGVAHADQAPTAYLVSDQVVLGPVDDSGDAPVDVQVVNLTTAPVAVSGVTGPCTISVDKGNPLPPLAQTTVSLTTHGCTKAEAATFDVTFSVGGAAMTVHATRKAPAKKDWSPLTRGFGGASLGFALLVAGVVGWFGSKHTGFSLGSAIPVDKTWSFSTSWAANATVVATVFTGLFSSDVMKTVLGDNGAKHFLGLVTVGVALAAATLTAASLVILAASKPAGPPVWAMAFAAWITVAGTAGEILTIGLAGRKLALGGAQHAVTPLVVAALFLLACYTVRTLNEKMLAALPAPSPLPDPVPGGPVLHTTMSLLRDAVAADKIAPEHARHAIAALSRTDVRMPTGRAALL